MAFASVHVDGVLCSTTLSLEKTQSSFGLIFDYHRILIKGRWSKNLLRFLHLWSLPVLERLFYSFCSPLYRWQCLIQDGLHTLERTKRSCTDVKFTVLVNSNMYSLAATIFFHFDKSQTSVPSWKNRLIARPNLRS